MGWMELPGRLHLGYVFPTPALESPHWVPASVLPQREIRGARRQRASHRYGCVGRMLL